MASVARWCCCGGCTPTTNPCSDCSDVTPASYSVTLSGISFCPACTLYGNFAGYMTFSENAGFSINDTFTVVQQGPPIPCTYVATVANAVNLKQYNTSDCSDTPISRDYNFRVVLRHSPGNQWELIAQVFNAPHELSFYGLEDIGDDGAGNFLCATVPAFTNQCTTCANTDVVGYGESIATGGTATVVCV